MRKILLTLAVVLALSVSVFAQNGGGLFHRGAETGEQQQTSVMFHNTSYEEQNETPAGPGVMTLSLFAAAYMFGKNAKKKRK